MTTTEITSGDTSVIFYYRDLTSGQSMVSADAEGLVVTSIELKMLLAKRAKFTVSGTFVLLEDKPIPAGLRVEITNQETGKVGNSLLDQEMRYEVTFEDEDGRAASLGDEIRVQV